MKGGSGLDQSQGDGRCPKGEHKSWPFLRRRSRDRLSGPNEMSLVGQYGTGLGGQYRVGLGGQVKLGLVGQYEIGLGGQYGTGLGGHIGLSYEWRWPSIWEMPRRGFCKSTPSKETMVEDVWCMKMLTHVMMSRYLCFSNLVSIHERWYIMQMVIHDKKHVFSFQAQGIKTLL